MRIAQIAPLTESVPPKLYGGTERIVSYLTEELVRQGHDVTLFASGDSDTSARLIPCTKRALRLDGNRNPLTHNMIMLDAVRRHSDEFDILHFHIDILHYPLLRSLPALAVTTLHGRLDMPELHHFYLNFPEQPLVSISLDQRRPMPPVNWAGNVYHGLPPDLLAFNAMPSGGYLAFLGRISPEKRPDRAIKIAAMANMPLKIAAKVDSADQEYWASRIEPMLKAHPNVEYIGEITQGEKAAFLGGAAAMLFPIDWPEPFGLAMIEAMACGTPVIAFARGSVPEVINDGVTGVVVNSVSDAAAAVEQVRRMDRALVRKTFERRFSTNRMAADYLKIYGSICDDRDKPRATIEPDPYRAECVLA